LTKSSETNFEQKVWQKISETKKLKQKFVKKIEDKTLRKNIRKKL
jgi:hypothetical protein